MFTSNEQISPPSLVLNCKVAKFCIKECPKAVNLKRISTQKECKCKEFSLQTRLGGEICSSDLIMHKGHLSTPWSNIDWQYWPWVSGCTNYLRSIVGNEYCLTRQKWQPRETTGCLSGPETLTMRWMFAVQYGLEQGSKMNGFYLKQGQGLKASVANPYPNFHKCFPPPVAPGTQTVSYFVLISSSLETQTDFH